MMSPTKEWLSDLADKLSGQSKATEERKQNVYTRYETYNQQHVFDHWNDLTSEQKLSLLYQLENIKVEELKDYLKDAQDDNLGMKAKADIKPFTGKVSSSKKDSKYLKNTCYNLGLESIKKNEVATILLAGGQGTRLGFDGPKGMFDIGMPSKRSLFCMIAERIVRLSQIAAKENDDKTVHIPLYIMTSPMNHETTKNYFISHNFFGLPADDVKFFAQGTLPCLSPEGLIIMESNYQCAMAPDGNGGIYPAMDRCGVLEDMKRRGIKHIHAFAIDNALVKPADPIFIGYCIDERADCGNKVLWKQDAHEKVGVIAERGQKPCVIEYSELSQNMAEQTKGFMGRKKLVYGAANICNHYYSISFLEDKVWPNQGKYYHIAKKKIPYWDDDKNETVTPAENNGIKLESFIFDVFPLSSSMAILEVEREEEFAPVKNAPGSSTDSPETAREKLSNLAVKWLRDAGAVLVVTEEGKPCEIGPLTSYSGEGLDEYKDRTVECPFSI